jgi:hypothetical protein
MEAAAGGKKIAFSLTVKKTKEKKRAADIRAK